MTALSWNAAMMTTAIPEIDEQHKQIVAGVNGLHEAMQEGRAKEELGNTLSFLISYAAAHFAKEEACMTQYNCPAAAANLAAHKAFVIKVTAFQGRLAAEGPTPALVLALNNELAAWLMTHICRIDAQLAPSVRAAAA
jgi:hemerythrin